MLFIDIKYANIIGSRLRNFKQKESYLWNYSCPVCGDSSKNKLKARGYIYRKKTDLFVKCHNCGYGTNLGNLIKYVDESIYKDYVFERYKEGAVKYNSHKDIGEFVNDTTPLPNLEDFEDDVLATFTRLDKLPEDHYSVQYVKSRKIPTDRMKLLYHSESFKADTNKIFVDILNKPAKFEEESVSRDIPRLILPYFDIHGKVFGYQGRAYDNTEPKYFTIKFDESYEKVYGLDRVDYSKRVYAVEGPIDTLFVDNFIAISGSSTFNTPSVQRLKTNLTIVIDNEPRNKQIVQILGKIIDQGFSVCIMPNTITQKDINDLILSGMSPSEIKTLIDQNTYNGAEALLKFIEWKKI